MASGIVQSIDLVKQIQTILPASFNIVYYLKHYEPLNLNGRFYSETSFKAHSRGKRIGIMVAMKPGTDCVHAWFSLAFLFNFIHFFLLSLSLSLPSPPPPPPLFSSLLLLPSSCLSCLPSFLLLLIFSVFFRIDVG